MMTDPKAYNRLQRMWGLPRTQLRRQIAAARGEQDNAAARKSTKRVRPPLDKGKERLSSLADLAAADDEEVPHAEHAPHVGDVGAGGDDSSDETTGDWRQLTDAERDMLPMAFPAEAEAQMARLNLGDQPVVVAQPPPRPVVPDPPTFLQDCQILVHRSPCVCVRCVCVCVCVRCVCVCVRVRVRACAWCVVRVRAFMIVDKWEQDELWGWTRTNVEFVRDAAAWSAMVRKYAKDKSIPNLNINLNW
jgi:hypothetical protein